jgi:hypothetical protein
LFFNLAIQTASVVTLAQASFGVGADGMGAITMKVGWTASPLMFLPLLPLLLRSQLFTEGFDFIYPTRKGYIAITSLHKTGDRGLIGYHGDEGKSLKTRQGHRLFFWSFVG